jgi:hypothetical protein
MAQSADASTSDQPTCEVAISRGSNLQSAGAPFFHFRDRDDFEVDIVIERGAGTIAGIEVKAAATATERDFRKLRKLKEAAGHRFAHGVVLYDGDACTDFGAGFHAVPLRALWETV